MKKKAPYDRIEDVMRAANRPLAVHEFEDVPMTIDEGELDGRNYIGYSEQTLARRLREMNGLGRVSSKTREGKNFKEYALVAKVAAPADTTLFPPETVAA